MVAAPEERGLPLVEVIGREGKEAPLRRVGSMDDTSLSPWPSIHSPAPLSHLDQLWALSLLITVYKCQVFNELAPKLRLHFSTV